MPLESIGELDHVKIRAATIGAVEAGVGIVLEPVAGPKVAVQRKAGPHSPDDLKRPSEILLSKVMMAEQRSTDAYVNGKTPIPTPEEEGGDHGRDKSGISSAVQCAEAHQEFRADPPAGLRIPFQRKSHLTDRVELSKGLLLLFSEDGRSRDARTKADAHEA